jgi:uncharacterized membrane protein YedE/YeeE
VYYQQGKEAMMETFTPISGLIGGLLIGLATVLLLLFNGKIAGISGIVSGLLSHKGSEVEWRAVFIGGLLLGAFIYVLATGGALPVYVQASLPVIVIAGLLVGFGSRLGSGCNSGHGIAGIARLSRRSIVATLMFFATATITVFVTQHIL